MQLDRSGCVRRFALGVLASVAISLVALPSPALAAPAVLLDQTDPKITFSGAWATYSDASLAGASHAVSVGAGAEGLIAFVGTRLDVLSMVGPKLGIASVSVDGGTPLDVDLYAPATAFQQTVFTTGDLEPALHLVRFTASGGKNAASADVVVSFDAALVAGTPVRLPVEQSDYRIAKRGGWLTYGSPVLSGGTHIFSASANDEYAVAFTGTRLDLVGMLGPKCGIAAVSVDGAAPVDIDLYRAATSFRQVFFTTGDLAAGSHVVRVYVTGRKNAAAGDAFVSLDAALAEGTLAQALIRYEETDPRLGWAGELGAGEASSHSAGRYVWAGPGWGAVRVRFEGARLDWVGTLGPQYGIAAVSVDGGPPVDVDLYAPLWQPKQVVFTTGQLSPGEHTVLISWSGRRNAAATNTYISYDAFDIGGAILQAEAPTKPAFLSFNYPWNTYIVVDKSDLRLYYVLNSALVATYPVAVGKPSTPTPNGIWRIDAKYYTDPGSVYGPRKMRLFRQQGGSFVFTAYNIHGTNVDSSVSTYASHGCIRMHNYDVIPFFDTVALGTMVVTRD